MENILETREADRPVVENAGLQTEQPSIPMGEIPTENPVGTGEAITE